MLGFSGSSEKGKLALVFDIGSSSVGGALFYMENSGLPKIVLALREPINMEADLDPKRFLNLTIKSLEVVTAKICQSGQGAPKKIFCVLSSPWYVSQTRVIRLKKDLPFVFTSKLADELVKKEVSLFEEEHLPKYLAAGSPVRPIELKNIKVALNGYETATPENQKAKELEMTIFVSMSGEEILKKIEETIGKHFAHKSIKFSSFAMAAFAVVRDIFADQKDFLLIDIGGEMTDISLTKKSVLRRSVSFPIGRNFIIRGAAEALECSLEEARSYFSLFKDGHAAHEADKKIAPIINRLSGQWLAKFQESLANISDDVSIPATIYLAVDKDLVDFFSETILTEQFSQYTLAESKFKIVPLSSELFHGLASFKDDAIREPFLMIDSIYFSRFSNKI